MIDGGGMDPRQLKYFVEVSNERHFTRAARRLNVVQSGSLTSIKTPEEQSGALLFLRTTRRVMLTPVGRAFLAEARRAVAAAADARRVVAEMQELRRGRLSIGSIQGLAPCLTCRSCVTAFHNAFPDIQIRLVAGDTASLIQGV